MQTAANTSRFLTGFSSNSGGLLDDGGAVPCGRRSVVVADRTELEVSAHAAQQRYGLSEATTQQV